MSTEKLTLYAALGALIVGVLSALLQHRQTAVATGDSSPLTMGDTNTSFNYNPGSRNISLGGGGADTRGLSACGCGGSYGDFAVPKLNPIFGETQRMLPYTQKPQPASVLPVSLIGNGAAI